jgi:hypothetical protein
MKISVDCLIMSHLDSKECKVQKQNKSSMDQTMIWVALERWLADLFNGPVTKAIVRMW